MEYGSTVLNGIKNKASLATITGSITPCSNPSCFAQRPPEVGAERRKGLISRASVRCPECGREVIVAGGGNDFSCLYNAVIAWNRSCMDLKEHRPERRAKAWW